MISKRRSRLLFMKNLINQKLDRVFIASFQLLVVFFSHFNFRSKTPVFCHSPDKAERFCADAGHRKIHNSNINNWIQTNHMNDFQPEIIYIFWQEIQGTSLPPQQHRRLRCLSLFLTSSFLSPLAASSSPLPFPSSFATSPPGLPVHSLRREGKWEELS